MKKRMTGFYKDPKEGQAPAEETTTADASKGNAAGEEGGGNTEENAGAEKASDE